MSVRQDDKEFIVHFYKHAFVGIMLDWIREDMKTDPQTIINRLSLVLHGNLTAALERLRTDKP